MSKFGTRSGMARYAMGAVNRMVARWSWMPLSRLGGVGCSISSAAAPTRMGNSTSPPSPKVNASGGDPQNRSSGPGCRTCLEKVSQTASTSR